MATQVSGTQIRSAIVRANEKFMETFGRGDAAGLAELYTEDCQLLPPNSDTVQGRRAVGDFWANVMELGIKAVQLHTVEVEDHGDTAIEVSTATLYGAGDQEIDRVKYIVIWKQVNGEWKLHRDIWNSVRSQ